MSETPEPPAARQRIRRGILAHGRSAAAAFVCLVACVLLYQQLDPHYAVREWLVWPVAMVWGYVLLFTAACVGVGHLLLRRVWKLEQPLAETWLMSMGLGLALFVLCLYAVGALSLFAPKVALFLAMAFVIASARDLKRLAGRTVQQLREPPPRQGRLGWVVRMAAVAAGCVAFAIVYASGFTPAAISVDAACYHLPIAQDYARAGAIIPFPSEFNRANPHLASMVYTWAFLVPGLERPFTWMLALHLEFTMLVWKAVAVTVAAQWMLGDYQRRSLWTGLFLFPMVFAFAHGVAGGSDHFIGVWCVPMFIATCRLLRRFDLRWAALLGVFSGGAILTKYQAIYMICACGSLIAARWLWAVGSIARRREPPLPRRRLWQVPLAIVGIGMAVASPHFIKNMLFYGDPLYPFLQAKLASAHPTHPMAEALFQANLGVEANRPTGEGLGRLVEAVRAFWEFSFHPHYVNMKQAWPLLGSLFTLLVPALLFIRRSSRAWIAVWCCFVVIAVWSNTYMQDRYLNAAMPLFAAVTVVIVVRLWGWNVLTRAALVPVVALQLAWGMDAVSFTGRDNIDSTLTLARSAWEGRLDPEVRYPWYRTFDFVNEATAPDAQVLVKSTNRLVGLERFAHRDLMSRQANFYYAPLKNAADLWHHYTERGITHVVYRKSHHSAGTLQSVLLFDDLLHRTAPTKTESDKWVLIELPPQPPATGPVLEVAVFGEDSLYADGLYRVEDLDRFDEADVEARSRPQPRGSARDPQQRLQLAAKADIVVVSLKRNLGAEFSRFLTQHFVLFETAAASRIYLRKLGG